MEELIIEYLLCSRPCARHFAFTIQFNHHEESYEVDNIIPFVQIIKLSLKRLIYLPKFMGFNPCLSDFRNSQAPTFTCPTQPRRHANVSGIHGWEVGEKVRIKEER